eukprot:COSAG02_NODE_5803_length_4024_cov_60.505700_5_plen_94_part_00
MAARQQRRRRRAEVRVPSHSGWRQRSSSIEKQQYRKKLGKQKVSIDDVRRSQHDKVTMDDNLQRIQDEKRAKAGRRCPQSGGAGGHHHQHDVR